jgi:glycerophosphoryl diester phosphodiesterase
MQSSVYSVFIQRWRELAGFAVLFRLFESLLFVPAAGLVGRWLLGRPVLDSTAMVAFVLSARGFLSLLLAASTVLCIRLVEHAGLSAIFFAGFDGRRISVRQALRLVGRNLPAFVWVSLRFVIVGLLALLPLLAVAGGFASPLLKRHDVNYYLKVHPPEFIVAAVVIGVVALSTAVLILALVVRWRWVVELILFRHRPVRAAFAQSASLSRGWRGKLLSAVAGVTLFAGLLSFGASAVGSKVSALAFWLVGDDLLSLAVSFGVLLLLRTIIGAVCSFLGSCLDAGIFTAMFRRRTASLGLETSLLLDERVSRSPGLRWLLVALPVGMCAFTVSSTMLALEVLPIERGVSIHAHRGVTAQAPENTLGAVRAAIAAGADYVETDVQLSKDGVLVIAHDSDFSRLGGVSKKVWDLTYDEIRAIPLGVREPPEIRREATPTLDALLAEAKGHLKVNIELKYYGDHQPGLARKVIETVRAQGMLDQVVVQCLEYQPLLEVRQLAPEVPIGYLLSFNAKRPSRLAVNFLSVEQKRLDRKFVLSAHQHGLQVLAWTVNTAKDMERLLDLGVDGLITDQSELARKTLDDYLNHPTPERAVRRVQSWLEE